MLVYNNDSRTDMASALQRQSGENFSRTENAPLEEMPPPAIPNKPYPAITAETTYVYDGYGHLVSINNSSDTLGPRRFYTDASGQILLKEQGGAASRALVVNGEMLGMSGINGTGGRDGTADSFGSHFVPTGDGSLTGAPTSYTVQREGETLRDIALGIWGDGSLWILIADANGIGSSDGIKKGDVITIPVRGTLLHNDYTTFKPYSDYPMTGDVIPQLPMPAAEQGCGRIGQAIQLAVSIVATNLFGSIPGNIAAQVVAMAMGNQDSFSWDAVARAALTAGAASGVNAYLGPIAESLEGIDTALEIAKRAAVSSILAQGASMAADLQDRMKWNEVAAASVSRGIGEGIRDALASPDVLSRIGPLGASIATSFGQNLASAILGGDRVDMPRLAMDSFGNGLANAWQPQAGESQQQSSLGHSLDSNEWNWHEGGGYNVYHGYSGSDGDHLDDPWSSLLNQAIASSGPGMPDDATDAEWMNHALASAGFDDPWRLSEARLARKMKRMPFSDARFEYGKLAYAANRAPSAEQVWQQKLDAARGLWNIAQDAIQGLMPGASVKNVQPEPKTQAIPAPTKHKPFNLVRELDNVPSLSEPSNFKTAMQFSMRWEGGYVNDPSDRGGETNFGISKRAYPSEDMRSLTLARAVDLYRRDYWDALHLDNYETKPAIVMMDIAINHGTGRASKWSKVTTDPDALLDRRVQFYRSIVERDPSQQKFLNGWLKRTDSLRSYIKDK